MGRAIEVAETIIKLEKAALDRWGQGDPSGFMELSAQDVTYFDPFIGHRIDGLPALTKYYENLRGKVQIDRYELIDPKVECFGDIAILTFNYISFGGTEESRWNCTEVYRHFENGWKIIQTHWSLTQPRLTKS